MTGLPSRIATTIMRSLPSPLALSRRERGSRFAHAVHRWGVGERGMLNSIDRAKQLRREMTDAEQKLWRYLRAHRLLGEKFRRQQPIGNYIVDFVHLSSNVIVEADGGQHADSTNDAQRDAWLHAKGFTILRFWNNDILINTTAVLEKILEAVKSKAPPSPF